MCAFAFTGLTRSPPGCGDPRCCPRSALPLCLTSSSRLRSSTPPRTPVLGGVVLPSSRGRRLLGCALRLDPGDDVGLVGHHAPAELERLRPAAYVPQPSVRVDGEARHR